MENKIYVRVPKEKITLLTKIMESYDNLAIVSTINPGEGLVVVHLTPDTRETVAAILDELDFVKVIPG